MTHTTGDLIGSGARAPRTVSQEWSGHGDDGLLPRLRAGDESACEALVRAHAGRMLAVARRFLRSEEDSADAVQDAFLSAFRSLDSFEGNSALGTWLHRIVVNTCLMKLRARSRSRVVPIDDLLPAFDEAGRHARPVRPWEEPHASRLTRDETRAQVRACIDRLPEPYRTVLLLRDAARLSGSAISPSTRRQQATASSRRCRGIRFPLSVCSRECGVVLPSHVCSVMILGMGRSLLTFRELVTPEPASDRLSGTPSL
jgi:RNA polymerase sigma-70 factor (ECF subfamily)